MLKAGINPDKLRFRQHMANEMAHYACDCWDAEILTSYGWVECVGCADRSAYDLTQHSKATGVSLNAVKKLAEPKTVEITEMQPNKSVLGKAFKKDAKNVTDLLANLSLDDITTYEAELASKGDFQLTDEFKITKEMVNVKRQTKQVHEEKITPSVIEPSFGIGRIMYAIFEHNFKVREGDEQRTFFSLPPTIAPLKASVLPLSGNPDFSPIVKKISKSLTETEVSHKVDDSSGAIGRRYARTDEIAIPYGICIDFDSLKQPETATLRERDSMTQVRIPVEEIATVIRALSSDKMSWKEVTEKYPKFEQQETKA